MTTSCIKYKACTSVVKNPPCPCQYYIPRPGSTQGRNKKMEITMSNKLTDLNEHLFAQLDRLSKSNGDELNNEITRAAAMCGVSTQIINNAALALKAHTSINTGMTKRAPKMLDMTDE